MVTSITSLVLGPDGFVPGMAVGVRAETRTAVPDTVAATIVPSCRGAHRPAPSITVVPATARASALPSSPEGRDDQHGGVDPRVPLGGAEQSGCDLQLGVEDLKHLGPRVIHG